MSHNEWADRALKRWIAHWIAIAKKEHARLALDRKNSGHAGE